MAIKLPGRHWLWAGSLIAVLGVAGTAFGAFSGLAGHWAAPVMAFLQARGVLSGDELGQVAPDAILTRAELSKLIVTGLGNGKDADLLSHYQSRFTDISNASWAKGYIESLAELGVTDGYPDGSFGPDDSVTRAQLAVILVRAAGLAENARQERLAPSSYTDDREIPDWARGSVQVALSSGLMAGFPDGSFRPQQPVTRAEGSVALFRLLGLKGIAYHLEGTLVRFNPGTLQGVVRDELGQERSFGMAGNAQYDRGGVAASAGQVQVLDQVWIVLGPDGLGQFLDARYSDLLGTDATVTDGSVTVSRDSGIKQTFKVQPGALLYLNGRAVTLSQLNGVPQIYIATDRVTGAARVLDGVNAPIHGSFVGADVAKATIYIMSTEPRVMIVDPGAVILLNGQKAPLGSLQPDDRLQIAVNDAGQVTYLQAER